MKFRSKFSKLLALFKHVTQYFQEGNREKVTGRARSAYIKQLEVYECETWAFLDKLANVFERARYTSNTKLFELSAEKFTRIFVKLRKLQWTSAESYFRPLK